MFLLRIIAGVGLLWIVAFPATADRRAVDEQLVFALQDAIADTSWYTGKMEALVWMAEMAERLRDRISDPFYRVHLLKIVYREARRVDLQPELVLALIEVESGFNRFAVSSSGARGLMQVMPFWKKEIGHPRDNLFHAPTNLRYGCTILRRYLDSTQNVRQALHHYNGRHRDPYIYPQRVLNALRDRWQPLLAQR